MRPFPLLLTVALLGCADPFSPPAGAMRFDPPAEWATWHAQVLSCMETLYPPQPFTPRAFSDIDWFTVPGATFSTDEWTDVNGLWVAPSSIYIAEHSDLRVSVQHELVHLFLQRGAEAHGTLGFYCANVGI